LGRIPELALEQSQPALDSRVFDKAPPKRSPNVLSDPAFAAASAESLKKLAR
jgi:hypothetical protein